MFGASQPSSSPSPSSGGADLGVEAFASREPLESKLGQEILVLGLNPAWQRLFSLPHALVPGEVHRLPTVVEYASGKGINAARVLQTLGVQPVVAHFLGGATGVAISQECDRIGLPQISAPVQGATRICTTLAEPKQSDDSGSSSGFGRSTELIEMSPSVDHDSSGALIQVLAAQRARFGAVLICGTFPEGFDGDQLAQLDWTGREVMIDAVRGCDALLRAGVALLKINESEIRGIFNRLGLVYPEGSPLSPDFWAIVGERLRNCWPVRDLVVTRGAEGAVVVSGDGSVILLQGVSGVLVRNTIGAGDAFLAGWAAARQMNCSVRECLVRAQAVALARCEVDLPWDFSLDRVAFWESRCHAVQNKTSG